MGPRSDNTPGFSLMTPLRLVSPPTRVLSVVALLAWGGVSAGWPASTAAQDQLTVEQQAAQVINAGRRAWNEKQYNVAADRFREYLKTYGNQKDATAARYGLGIVLLDGPQRDLKGAVEVLTQAAGDGGFVDRPSVLYYLATALRAQGYESLALADAKPNEAGTHRPAATRSFQDSLARFAEATAAFTGVASKTMVAEGAALPVEWEWAARCRCDHAELLLRTDKIAECRDHTKPFVDDKILEQSRFRKQGMYFHGYAQFLLKDYVSAGRALATLAPFTDPVVGIHAQYLMARTHHLANEREEAAPLYAAVVTRYEQSQKDAQAALQNPKTFEGNPDEKLRLEKIVATVPDYVLNALFHAAVLLYEQKQFPEAADRFNTFATKYPQSPLVPEARLRQGFCQVELKQHAEALKTLQPLSQVPPLADRALLWMARAQRGLADPAQPPQFDQAQKQAVDWLKQAMDRATQIAAQDPDAKLRRVECQLELADAQIAAKLPQDSANTYQAVINEDVAPDRGEETLQRLTAALHLAKQWDAADAACVQFEQKFPQSTLLPAVLFRKGENAYHRAMAADPGKPLAQSPERQKWLAESIKRYLPLLEKFPEFPFTGVARFHLGLAYFQMGDVEKAMTAFREVPQQDRQGELAAVPYHLADGLIRTLPADTADDALAVGRLVKQLAEAITLLEGFVGANEKSPHLPDALVKLGVCSHQLAAQIAEPQERNLTFQKSRTAFDRVINQFAADPKMPVAVYERARAQLSQGDVGGAFNEFNRFKTGPLNAAPIAPLGWLRASMIQRSQNQAQQAAESLQQCRAQYEGPLAQDPARADWVPLIQYHHGLALRDWNKLPEARAAFEGIVARFPNWSDAPQAAWRLGQVRREEALLKYAAGRALEAKPGAKPEELAAAKKEVDDSLAALRDIGKYFRDQAAALVPKMLAGSEIQQRMFYEAAWTLRTPAEVETALARAKLAEESLKKMQEALANDPEAAKKVVDLRAPEIAITQVPVQPSETAIRESLTALIDAAPEAPLAQHARLELAEVLAQRDEHDAAIPLLVDAIDLEPPVELEERLRLRLGTCLLAKKDADAAYEQFAPVAANDKSPNSPEARYRAGECRMLKENWAEAIKELLPFRDHGPLQNIAGLSDRAVLRLGHAFGLAGQWDQSRGTLETLVSRHPNSPWKHEARYGIGWAWQNLKSYDNAATAYATVVRETASDAAPRAQIQTALCRAAQNRPAEALSALLVVPLTYDYPEWNAMALYEASRIYVDQKEPQQAVRLLERVKKDYPATAWAKLAGERLIELEKAVGPLTMTE